MLIALDPALEKPLYRQIRDQLRGRMASGTLKPGDRLEPSRELARRLGVHRTTVSNAYAELQAEGLIEGTVGRGTFVSTLAVSLPRQAPARSGDDLFWKSFFAEEAHDDSLDRLMASAFEPGVISFAVAHGAESPSLVDVVRRAADRVLRRQGAQLLQYGSSDGYPPLRSYLVSRLRRDGLAVTEDEILITNGCQQSLDLLQRALLRPGDAVACENPSYPGLWNVFASSQVQLIGIPVGREGMDLDHLAAVLERHRVRLIVTSPSFQNPTGSTLPLAARKRLLELARRFQSPLVEDDVYGALRYRGAELPPLKFLDASGVVIHLNSFSKIGFPGLRVGWMVAPPRVIERLRGAKRRADLHTNLLAQAVFEELGRRGWLDRWLRRTRKLYAGKLRLLLDAARRHFPPQAACLEPEGGVSVWVELPESIDAADLLVKARDRGLIFAPGRFFYFEEPQCHTLRLCFSAAPDEEIERGVAILGDLLKAEMGRRARESKKPSRVNSGMALV